MDDQNQQPEPNDQPDRPDVEETAPIQPIPAAPARSPYWQPTFEPPIDAPVTESLTGSHYLGGTAAPSVVRSRPSGWVWPVVTVLAMVLGAFGGVVGAVGFNALTDDEDVVLGGLGGVQLQTQAPLTGDEGSVAAVAQALLPSTVQILAEYNGQADGATGSGFVLDRQGHIVTNNHVVADAAKDDGGIEIVDRDGNRFEATIVGRSAVYDLAVLHVPDATDLEPAALGSTTNLRVGETVVAFGSPLGLSSTVTSGIVSALGRPVTTGASSDESSYISAVQTDAAINPGNSGGPLVNLLGQVVGVNSAIATTGGSFGGESGNIGVGFAIPIEQVKITADQILRTGEASYPIIGAQVETGTSDGQGAVISEVTADSAAEAGGLHGGDRITSVDGVRVSDGIGLIVAIRTHQPGQTVTFDVVRDGRPTQVEITLRSQVG